MRREALPTRTPLVPLRRAEAPKSATLLSRPLPRPFHHCATSVAAADTLIKFEGWKGRARARARVYGYTYSFPRILEYPQGKSPIRLSPTRRIRAKIREKSFSRSLRAFIIYRPMHDCSRVRMCVPTGIRGFNAVSVRVRIMRSNISCEA